MILTVCADTGSPGATTVATVLSVVGPAEPVLLLEGDPSGGDLAFRLRDPAGGLLAREPTVLSAAADAREGLPAGSLATYAQRTSLGVRVLLGAGSAESYAPMARLWPHVAAEAARWPGTVVADVGRLQPGNAAGPIAGASTGVLLVTRADAPEQLYHARDRAADLAARLGQGPHPHGGPGRSPLAVVVVCPSRVADRAVGEVRALLAADAATSTIPVAGYLAHDPGGVAALGEGALSRRLWGSDLIRSARGLVETLLQWWPDLLPAPTPVAPRQAGSPSMDESRSASPVPALGGLS